MNNLQKFLEKLFIEVAAFFFWLAIVLVNRTLKIVYIEEVSLTPLKEVGHSLIYGLWHSQSFVPFYFKRREKVVLLTTAARRGQILNSTVKRFGFRIFSLPGFTSSQTWLLELFKLAGLVKNEGYDAGFVLDGPNGPAGEIKPGVFLLSAKTGNPIIPVGVGFSAKLSLFWRWDRYQVPVPFSKVVLLCGAPLFYEGEISSKRVENYKKLLLERLSLLNKKAGELARNLREVVI